MQVKYYRNVALLLILAGIISRASEMHISDEFVTIAILAKDKAHTLPLYLACIEAQTWPKKNTYLYIRTNNNNDETAVSYTHLTLPTIYSV